jgi:hypothetical protein
VDRLLAELAGLGPFFAVETHEPGAPLRGPWQPLAGLTAGSTSLAARIGQVRGGLAAAAGCAAGDVELRVAGSVTQLGVAARLISPALGAAVLGGALRIDPAQARWVPSAGGPFRLSVPVTAVSESTVPGTAECLALLAGPVSQLVEAVAATGVSRQVLWGNVASAVNGATTMITAARPGLAAGIATEAAAALLRSPALTGSWEGAPGAGFRRRNCCLIYRLSPSAPAAVCGDCILRDQAA